MKFVHFTHLSKKGTLSCEKWTKKLFSLSCFKSSRLHLDLKLLAKILEIIFLLLVSFLLFTQIFENGIPCVKIYYMLSLLCRAKHCKFRSCLSENKRISLLRCHIFSQQCCSCCNQNKIKGVQCSFVKHSQTICLEMLVH